jgi:hypothetical protein
VEFCWNLTYLTSVVTQFIPITGLWGPESSGRLRLPDSVTSTCGRLSALLTGRLYPQEYPGTRFKRLSRPRAHGIVGCHVKNPSDTTDTTGIDPGTLRLVAYCLNHYATPGPRSSGRPCNISTFIPACCSKSLEKHCGEQLYTIIREIWNYYGTGSKISIFLDVTPYNLADEHFLLTFRRGLLPSFSEWIFWRTWSERRP